MRLPNKSKLTSRDILMARHGRQAAHAAAVRDEAYIARLKGELDTADLCVRYARRTAESARYWLWKALASQENTEPKG